MILRVLDVLVLRPGQLYQHMPEESDTINQFKITILKNGNQNLVYVDHVKFICKISAKYELKDIQDPVRDLR